MNEKLLAQFIINQHQQSVYMHAIGNLLLSKMNAVSELVIEVAKQSGLNELELRERFSQLSTQAEAKMSEFPFPEFQFPEDSSGDGANPQGGA